MKLFDGYQKEAVTTVVAALQGRGKALVDLATGLGKTVIAAHVTKKLRPIRTLVLCHDNDILKQTEKTFKTVVEMSTGFFSGLKKEVAVRILFSTLQLMREHKGEFPCDEFDLVIVDEAHHSMADTYEDVIRYFSGMKLGLTATPERSDGRAIEDIFGPAVVSITLEEAVALELLNPFEYRVVSDALDAEMLRMLTKDLKLERRFSMADVNKRIFIEKRDEEIVKHFKEVVAERKTIVFCRNLAHASRIAQLLGDSAEEYHSGLTKAVARDVLPRFRNGTTRYLVVVNKANEGVDVPDAEAVVFLRTTESRTVFLQQLGRSLRKHPGKRKTLVLDFVGSIERMIMLRELIRTVEEFSGKQQKKRSRKASVSVTGEAFNFVFDQEVIQVLDLLSQMRHRNFYPTWQEVGVAIEKLGIKSQNQYYLEYKKDERLPAAPDQMYRVSWAELLGKTRKRKTLATLNDLYETVDQAAVAAQKLGIRNRRDYEKRWREDPMLPSNIQRAYAVSWLSFFKKNTKFTKEAGYATWQEAAAAAKRIGITSSATYAKLRKLDPKLPSGPAVFGITWATLLGKSAMTNRDFYTSVEEAANATKKLGIQNSSDYPQKRKADKRLPAAPPQKYGLASWVEFFDLVKKCR